jgi:hypothetical protein
MTDDDIYTEDDNLDAVLMTAPDAATVAYAGEVSLPMAPQIGSTWTHASRTIGRRRYAIPYDGHPRGAVVLILGRSAQRKSSDGPESAAAHVDLRRGREASDFAARKGANTWETH